MVRITSERWTAASNRPCCPTTRSSSSSHRSHHQVSGEAVPFRRVDDHRICQHALSASTQPTSKHAWIQAKPTGRKPSIRPGQLHIGGPDGNPVLGDDLPARTPRGRPATDSPTVPRRSPSWVRGGSEGYRLLVLQSGSGTGLRVPVPRTGVRECEYSDMLTVCVNGVSRSQWTRIFLTRLTLR